MAKRLFDVFVSGVLLVVLSPVFVLCALAVRLGSRGPVFFRATRVGLHGKPFVMLKFRTMRTSTSGSAITMSGDPRVTAVGRVLRKLKLDELPQLLNVMAGQMSLVGPRPEDPKYVAAYTDDQRRVLSVRPGMTSPAAVRYRHEERILAEAEDLEAAYTTTVLPAKLELDLEYIDHRSLRLDLKVLFSTLAALFKRE